jgi:predicted nucleic acid-binding protein
MTLVLDVSAGIEILLQREKCVLFGSIHEDSDWVIAPSLYMEELTNVLWKYCKAGLVTHAQCMELAEDGLSLVDDFFDAKDYWKEALAEGIKNSHSIYDLYYAILARRNDATLLTNDKTLHEMCRAMNIKSVC